MPRYDDYQNGLLMVSGSALDRFWKSSGGGDLIETTDLFRY